MLDEALLALLGFGAGAVGSLVGLGGGVVMAPVLTLLGFPPTVAVSSSLVGAFGNISAATLTHALRRRLRYGLGLQLGLAAVPGAVMGAWLVGQVEPAVFKVLFGTALLAVCAYVLLRSRMRASSKRTGLLLMGAAAGASFLAGLVSSFFGIGGGIVLVPLVMLVMGMSMKDGAASAQPALLLIVSAGIVSHGILGHTDIGVSIPLLIGAFFGGLLGVRISQSLDDLHLRLIISALISIVGARLIWEAVDQMGRVGLIYWLAG